MITKSVTLANGAPVAMGQITSLNFNPLNMRLNATMSLYADQAHKDSNIPIQQCPISQVITHDQASGNMVALAETLAIAKYTYLAGAVQS